MTLEILRRHLSFLEYFNDRATAKDPKVESENVQGELGAAHHERTALQESLDLKNRDLNNLQQQLKAATNTVTIAQKRFKSDSSVENSALYYNAEAAKQELVSQETKATEEKNSLLFKLEENLKRLKYAELLQEAERLDLRSYIQECLADFRQKVKEAEEAEKAEEPKKAKRLEQH